MPPDNGVLTHILVDILILQYNKLPFPCAPHVAPWRNIEANPKQGCLAYVITLK